MVAGLAFLGVASCRDADTTSRTGIRQPDLPGARDTGKVGNAANLDRLAALSDGAATAFDPPAPAGDLRADIAAFTTMEACIEHASVDPFLGDALQAIGYDSFVRDACLVIDAAKAHDLARCDAIDASMLRERCVATAAEVTGDADACPWLLPGRREGGRDPSCVAISLRVPSLCEGAEPESSRATCRAITTRDSGQCARLTSRSERARCTRDAQRYGPAVSPREVHYAPPAAPTGTFWIAGANGTHQVDIDLTPDLSRGVVLVQRRGAARLVVGPLHDESSALVAVSPYSRATLGFALLVPIAASPGKGDDKSSVGASLERMELSLPSHAMLSSAALRSVVIHVQELEVRRAAAISITIEGALQLDGSSRSVRAEMTTFVRDVVTAAALSGVPSPRSGAEGAMPTEPKTR